MTSVRNVAATLTVTGLVGFAGYFVEIKPTKTLDDGMEDVDRIIALKDRHGCLGLARTEEGARDSYAHLCNKGKNTPDNLATSPIGKDLIAAYRR